MKYLLLMSICLTACKPSLEEKIRAAKCFCKYKDDIKDMDTSTGVTCGDRSYMAKDLLIESEWCK